MVPLELKTEIPRLCFAEHWKVGTIAVSADSVFSIVTTAEAP